MASSPSSASSRGFTLVELLTAMTVFLIMLGIFASILNSVYKAWEMARRETEIAQNARAILGLIEKDLTPALVSNTMQFGVNPTITNTQLPNDIIVPGSDSVFFCASGNNDNGQGRNQIGWMLTKPSGTNPIGHLYDLKRFYKEFPANMTPPAAGSNNTKIDWLEINSTKPIELESKSRVVSERILGLWIECLDRNDKAIPWLWVSDAAAVKLKFNSAARFQMAPPGVSFSGGKTFHYTDVSTLQANSLPAAIRITILLTDEATIARFASKLAGDGLPNVSAPAPNAVPVDVESSITEYRNSLAQAGVYSACYPTTIRLTNSSPL